MDKKKQRKRKFIYRMEIITIFMLAAAALAVGSAVVTVNSGNVMNGTQTVLFDLEKNDREITVIIMDKEYTLNIP